MFNILVVEDDADVRDVLADILREDGLFVQAVANGEVALILLKENIRFDLLVTDIMLPRGMDGFELADRAKALRPDLKVLYVTGFANLPRQRLGRLHGKIVTKPVHALQIRAEVRRLLAA